ncbi:MAG TPA: pyridoxal-phosphate dependent enzyme [Gaiellaceae bacterium]|nr:pyridoxal-phosphate dependent enzyme [Gaiellaceae bacterium]
MIALDEIRRARERLGDDVQPSPLMQLDDNVWLKLENLQPIGCFKLRGALSAVMSEQPQDLVTASAGNMAQAVAWVARRTGVRATIVVPETAPRAKLDKVEELGGEIVLVPYEAWWQAMVDWGYDGVEGLFIHPSDDPAVMAGNGTIGLELCEQLDAFDTVIVPWGGGGLTTGIASAVKALRPNVRVVAAEPENGAPLAASFAAGYEVGIDFTPSFVDGAGGPSLMPGAWERAQGLVDEAVAVPLDDVAEAMRVLASCARVVAEGAGALPLAAARGREGRTVCVISGGNIDAAIYAKVLAGETP